MSTQLPPPLLTYSVSSDQSPIQASPQTGDSSTVSLMIVVSNSTHQPIYCQNISFGFLQGTDAKDFFSDSTGIGTTAPTGWSLTQQGSTFTATPDDANAGQITGAGLTFVLSNIKVNMQPGAFDLTIIENASQPRADPPAPEETRGATVTLAKFPPQFTVGQLKADPVSVNQGESTTLSWDCSPGADYELQYLDGNNPVTITKTLDGKPLPESGTYTIENLQVNPTIFYLIVKMTLPGHNQPLVFDSWFPVAVSIPNVVINNFTASTKTVAYPGDQVTFTWDVANATQVQLNGDDVEGTSATIPINATGSVLLQAYGQGGPVTAHIPVTVTPVKINSFTATPSAVYGQNNNAPVTLAWDVQSGGQLLLNDGIVTGQSESVIVNEATTYTLEATGYPQSVVAETHVTIAPVNLNVSVDGTILNISFNANPGTYTALVTGVAWSIFPKPLPITFSLQATTSNFGAVQISRDFDSSVLPMKPMLLFVTLTGFPSGGVQGGWPNWKP